MSKPAKDSCNFFQSFKIIRVQKAASKVLLKAKIKRTSEWMSFLFWRYAPDLNHLNAEVRWTSACRQLDGGNTLFFLSIGKKNATNLAGTCSDRQYLKKYIND